jgi:hypothetical protein
MISSLAAINAPSAAAAMAGLDNPARVVWISRLVAAREPPYGGRRKR